MPSPPALRRIDRRFGIVRKCECHAPTLGHSFGGAGLDDEEEEGGDVEVADDETTEEGEAKEAKLVCDHCGVEWSAHQAKEALCPGLVERLEKLADVEEMIEAAVSEARKKINERARETIAAARRAADERVAAAEGRVAELAKKVSSLFAS